MPKLIDKTIFFQSLEQELLDSATQTIGLESWLEGASKGLERYFENKASASRALGFGALTFEYAFLQAHAGNQQIEANVLALLSEFRAARDLNPVAYFDVWVENMPPRTKAIANMASVAMLQTNKNDMELDVLAKSLFRDVGDILEGSLQPLLRLRLATWGFLGRRGGRRPPIESITFGAVVDELLKDPTTEACYRPLPYKLSANQWRNIANHNSYLVDAGKVVCTHGTRAFAIQSRECESRSRFSLSGQWAS
jgi:hypothetical protein